MVGGFSCAGVYWCAHTKQCPYKLGYAHRKKNTHFQQASHDIRQLDRRSEGASVGQPKTNRGTPSAHLAYKQLVFCPS
jgi:hypothetical protein